MLKKITIFISCAFICLIAYKVLLLTDSSSPERQSYLGPNRSVEHSRWWLGNDQPRVFKLNNELILAVPSEYQRFAPQDSRVIRKTKEMDLSTIPTVPSVGFSMFMPDFSGYTPANINQEFNDQRIDIIGIQVEDLPDPSRPGAPGAYPQNMFKNLINAKVINPDKFSQKFGLKCFENPNEKEELRALHPDSLISEFCLGEVNRSGIQLFMLKVHVPPYPTWAKYPLIQASYYSPLYGGINVSWRTNVKNLQYWRQIDEQIWKNIESWNIAAKSKSKDRYSSATVD